MITCTVGFDHFILFPPLSRTLVYEFLKCCEGGSYNQANLVKQIKIPLFLCDTQPNLGPFTFFQTSLGFVCVLCDRAIPNEPWISWLIPCATVRRSLFWRGYDGVRLRTILLIRLLTISFSWGALQNLQKPRHQ